MTAPTTIPRIILFDGVLMFPEMVRTVGHRQRKCASPKCENLVFDDAICRDCEEQIQQFAETSKD